LTNIATSAFGRSGDVFQFMANGNLLPLKSWADKRQPATGTRVGFTTTIPVEVILAAGLIPVDLNNIFISAADAYQRVSTAEEDGWPRTVCAWIKGIYTSLQLQPEIQSVIVVTQGDCSNTHALMELLEAEGRSLIPFQFPYPRNRELLHAQIEQLMAACGTDWPAVLKSWQSLAPMRARMTELDRLTWETGQVSGAENFQVLIASSDFNGQPELFAQELDDFLAMASVRPPRGAGARLGLIGIPPIFTDLFDYLGELGAQVVFNEIPRQFSMPYSCRDLTEQYLRYTYPYDIFARIADIAEAVALRRLDGLIHYTQSFCFRQIQDRLLRQYLNLPILTIEGDRPSPLDHRTRLRLEAFVDVLRR
jgi:benzoyl-CoA reductase/2-hydroxyglutaryl-CoA dehydratase subunit BcrC/BadD/HgdB